jgi:hypothetical protein
MLDDEEIQFSKGTLQYPQYMEKRMQAVLKKLGTKKSGELDLPEQFAVKLYELLEKVWVLEDAKWYSFWDNCINFMETIVLVAENENDAWKQIMEKMEQKYEEEINDGESVSTTPNTADA